MRFAGLHKCFNKAAGVVEVYIFINETVHNQQSTFPTDNTATNQGYGIQISHTNIIVLFFSARLLLTNHPMFVHVVKSCPRVNDCDLLAAFYDFYLPIFHLMPSMRGITLSYRVHIWRGKPRMAGLQSGEGRTMIDWVIWAQYTNVTDT